MKQAAKNIKIQMYLGNHRGLCWKHSFTYLGNKGMRSNKNKKSVNFSKNASEKVFYLVSRPYIFLHTCSDVILCGQGKFTICGLRGCKSLRANEFRLAHQFLFEKQTRKNVPLNTLV